MHDLVTVPGHEDVDKTFIGVKLGRDVVFNPLVDRLWRGVCRYLLQQLLLQLQQGEQEAQALTLQDLQHAVLVLVDFCHQVTVHSEDEMGNRVTMRISSSLGSNS